MFKNLEENAITRICGLIKPFAAMRGDVVYKRGEVGREIYIVIDGEIRINFAYSQEQQEASKDINTGSTFGEGCAEELFDMETVDASDHFHEPYKREDSAVARTDCELRFLTLNDLKEVCVEFPSVRVQMWILVEFYTVRVFLVALFVSGVWFPSPKFGSVFPIHPFSRLFTCRPCRVAHTYWNAACDCTIARKISRGQICLERSRCVSWRRRTTTKSLNSHGQDCFEDGKTTEQKGCSQT